NMNRDEIIKKKFNTVYRGLDEQAVRQHLSYLADIIDSKDERIKQLEEMLNERQENLNSFKSVETSIHEEILSDIIAGDEIKLIAQNQDNSIIQKAEIEAEKIIEHAQNDAAKMTRYTEELKNNAKIFRARYKLLIQAQLDLIETDDWEHLLKLDEEETEK